MRCMSADMDKDAGVHAEMGENVGVGVCMGAGIVSGADASSRTQKIEDVGW